MRFAAILLLAATFGLPAATQAQSSPQITFVHMGGNDCPPCIHWRQTELPKLQAAPAFAGVRFVHVTKTIGSPVPSAFWFPGDAKDLQPALAEAANGRSGSPHQALLVDGKVIDYWRGTEKGMAPEVLRLVEALKEGKRYPRQACVKLGARGGCERVV